MGDDNFQELLLTLCEPILGALLVDLVNWATLSVTIRTLVQHAVLEPLTKDAQHLVVDQTVPLELLIRLEFAHQVIRVALVDGGHTPELLVVPRVLVLIRLDDGF